MVGRTCVLRDQIAVLLANDVMHLLMDISGNWCDAQLVFSPRWLVQLARLWSLCS